jgi:alpha-ketoglutarate-dependent taurine dioxygenase
MTVHATTEGTRAEGWIGRINAEPGAESLAGLLEDGRAEIDAVVARSGAVLFRNFDIETVADFEAITGRLVGERLDYVERSTPRTSVGQKVFTSTEYPADQEIQPHNENSYQTRWPRWILFWCETEPGEGGETPLVDSAAVLRSLDPAVRSEFERRGVMYVRNYGLGVDLSWQEAFQTEDAEDVDRRCREGELRTEWFDDRSRLRTEAVRPAVVRHPSSGDELWFNQAHLFHPAALPPDVREALTEVFGDELPRDARFGDGGTIPDEAIDHVAGVYRELAEDVAWRRGDLLLVDNMRVAHGRKAFRAPRRILVAMAESVSAAECAE